MKKAENKLRWEEIAGIWDKGIGEEGDIRHKLVINPIVFEFLGNLRGKKILDAGCGNGYIARKMAKTAKVVVAVDFSDGLIKRARKKSQEFTNIDYRVKNIEELSLPDKYFDLVGVYPV